MKKHLLFLAAVIAMAPVASFAEEYEHDLTIHGRSPESLIASLAETGIDAERVEEWGSMIRVDARDPDSGSHYYVLLDKDTLQPRQTASITAHQASAQSSGSGWTAETFNPARSLIE